jgi:ABC-type dipeptide/oligopeptide/nickel transport system ATPase component
MYAGRIVESGPIRDLFHLPSHGYTLGLLGSTPRVDGTQGAAADADRGPAAQPDRSDPALPVPAALPSRRRRLPRAGTGARTFGQGHWATCFADLAP